MADLPDSFFTALPPLTNELLTEKTVNGNGTFDVIMGSVSTHLRSEYEANRITGNEYTKAYIELTTSALGAAVQYLLGKETAYWQAVLAQEQVKGVITDNDSKVFTLNELLPNQKLLLEEQIQVQRAQTMDTRLDGTTIIVGAVGKQKDLYNQQITSYKRDAEIKAAKLFTDAWITQKTLDEGLLAPNGFSNASLDTVLTAIKTNNVLT